jgi:hypothetical protein
MEWLEAPASAGSDPDRPGIGDSASRMSSAQSKEPQTCILTRNIQQCYLPPSTSITKRLPGRADHHKHGFRQSVTRAIEFGVLRTRSLPTNGWWGRLR